MLTHDVTVHMVTTGYLYVSCAALCIKVWSSTTASSWRRQWDGGSLRMTEALR